MLLGKVATGQVPADDLERAIIGHLEAQQAAWGDAVWLPKSHFALHLGMALRRFGYLLATFTQERKHQVVKRFLAPRRHTPGLERGIMEELTLQHLYEFTDLIGTQNSCPAEPAPGEPKPTVSYCDDAAIRYSRRRHGLRYYFYYYHYPYYY